MGGLGRSIEVRGSGDRQALHAAIWEHVKGFHYPRLAPEIHEDVATYPTYCSDNDSWGVEGDSLNWMFSDFSGNCTRSKYLWTHWTSIALAADWDDIVKLAWRHGLEITTERFELRVGGDDGFIELRGRLWLIMEDTLHVDGKGLGVDDLTADERTLVEAARVSCACAPCRLLRPKPAPPPPPKPDLPVVVVPSAKELPSLVEQWTRRVAAGWDTAISAAAALPHDDRAKAIHALAELPPPPELIARIRTALADGDDDTACALAELAGRLRGHAAELAPALAAVLDRSFIRERMRLAAVEGLVAIAAVLKVMPPEVAERLRRESDRGGDAAALAHTLVHAWEP